MDLSNYLFTAFWLHLNIIVCLIGKSSQQIKEYTLSDPKLCSEITKRTIRQDSFLVTPGTAKVHFTPWTLPLICKFQARSIYKHGGMVAVMQTLNLRKNLTNGECIDYIQFKSLKGASSFRFCGVLDARVLMNGGKDEGMFTEYYPISYGNSFIDVDGEMDVFVYIAKQALGEEERTAFEVVFTSYQDCGRFHMSRLNECGKDHTLRICIDERFFEDGLINCPHFGCLDEDGCLAKAKTHNSSVGNRVIVGSISTLGILFAVFILLIWVFKKHKLFCWSEQFAQRSATPRSHRDEYVHDPNLMEASCRVTNNPPPNAPTEESNKDLPPSYESLFPQS